MNKLNFNEFEEVSEKAWKQKIQADLKGKDYNSTMITPTDEGIDIKPFYHKDSYKAFSIPSPQDWFITKRITTPDYKNWEKDSNEGIERFWIDIEDLNEFNFLDENHHETIIQFKDGDLDKVNSSKNYIYAFDPLCNFAKSGNWLTSQAADLDKHQSFAEKTSTIAVDIRLYQEAGGNITQQLAYALSHLATYFKNLNSTQKDKLIILVINAVGTNYFFEIAKLKALKLLINSLCKEEKIDYKIKILSTPGIVDFSVYDYNVNMLRTTSISMSAILGGSDFICNKNYDDVFKNESDFSNRISKNQLLILKHESYFNKVQNPTEGSYYINQLIQSLAEKALELFKDIEKSGGFIQQLFDGKIQNKLEEQFKKTQEKLNTAEKIMVGVNKYINEDENMSAAIEKPITKGVEKRKTLIKPIVSRRYAEVIEKDRLNNENH
jgi:methylmalonyl-CoA mutase